jgi:primase-polymerase (primpol)-like protein
MYNLRTYDQWILWGERERSGKMTKIPMGKHGRATSVTNKQCWKSFDQAFNEYLADTKTFQGVGFCFSEEDPFVGIDLDNIRKWNGWEEIVEKLNSYTETSPSGNGLHIIVEGYLPDERSTQKIGSHETGAIEIYDNGRFFTMTLDPIDENHMIINRNQDAIEWLANSIDDKKLVNRIMNSNYARKAQLLWEGRWDVAGYASHSEADLAFCRILSNINAPMHQIDRIFKKTKLMRNKWNEKRGNNTYGKMTIEKALE